MQPCNRIYYIRVYWRLNMFRVTYRSSSGAPNFICNLWFIYTFSHSALTTAGHHMCIKSRGYKYSLEFLMMSGMPLETCWAISKLWNNKFCYKVASFWLFLLIHTTMHGYIPTKLFWNTEVFFDIMPRSPTEIHRRSEGTFCFHLLILKMRVYVPSKHQ